MATATKRIRRKVDSREVAHLWAHQAQDSAYGSASVSFSGRDYYSYSTVVARLVDGAEGRTAALISVNNWGPTTAKHLSWARQAVSHLTTFTVGRECFPSRDSLAGGYREAADNAGIMAYFARLAREAADVLATARTDKGPGSKARLMKAYEAARAAGAEADRFARFAGLPESYALAADPEIEAAIIERDRKSAERSEARRQAQRQKWARWEAEAPARAEAERLRREQWEAERKALEASRALDRAERIERWKAGETVYHGDFPETLLRAVGDEVETSKGARFPLDHARRFGARLLSAIREGRYVHPDGIKLGHYRVDAVHSDGSLTAGCHVISRAELERFAAVLGIEAE